MSKAFRPQGLLLQVDNPAGSGAGFTTIAEVKKVDFTGGKADTADVTNMDSTGHVTSFNSNTDLPFCDIAEYFVISLMALLISPHALPEKSRVSSAAISNSGGDLSFED